MQRIKIKMTNDKIFRTMWGYCLNPYYTTTENAYPDRCKLIQDELSPPTRYSNIIIPNSVGDFVWAEGYSYFLTS